MKKLLILLLYCFSFLCVFAQRTIITTTLTPRNGTPILFEEFTFDSIGRITSIINYEVAKGKWSYAEIPFSPESFYNWDSFKKTLFCTEKLTYDYSTTDGTITVKDTNGTIEAMYKYTAENSLTEFDGNGKEKKTIDLLDRFTTERVYNTKLISFWAIDTQPIKGSYNYSPENNSALFDFSFEYDGRNVYCSTEPDLWDDFAYSCKTYIYVSNYIPFTQETIRINDFVNAASMLGEVPFFAFQTIQPNSITYKANSTQMVWTKDSIAITKGNENLSFTDCKMTDVNGMTTVTDKKGKKVGLLLKNTGLSLFYKAEETLPYFIGSNSDYKREITPLTQVNSSSFLSEKTTVYSPINLAKIELNKPWVERVSGVGLGEKITLNKGDCTGMYLVNGYVSLDRPDLYEKNSRVQQLVISSPSTDNKQYELIIDTAKPQFIDLTQFPANEIELTITAVYNGTKYEDTCIAGIILVKDIN